MIVSGQFNYTIESGFYAFLLPILLSFQGSTHLFGVGSFSKLYFPLVLPKGILVAFSAKIVENEIIIRKDNIFVEKIVKNR